MITGPLFQNNVTFLPIICLPPFLYAITILHQIDMIIQNQVNWIMKTCVEISKIWGTKCRVKLLLQTYMLEQTQIRK